MNTEVIDILQGFFAEEVELVEEDFGATEALVKKSEIRWAGWTE